MLDNKPMSLPRELSYALDQLEHGTHPVFISGRAGTGKSTLLRLFISTTRRRVAVVAPTGVAALNVRGQTIHSFFRFPPRLMTRADIKRQKNYKLYENLEVLVIDEISMVRADQFDNMDYFLQVNRRNSSPFGGVRLIFFGDLFQLPPIIAGKFEKQFLAERYATPYFFSSHAYSLITEQLEYIELRTVHRQKEAYFIRILDSIRRNIFDHEDLAELNERIVPYDARHPDSIMLTTRNDRVRQINQMELAKLGHPEYHFTGKVSGKFDPRIYPTALNLMLKKGAQVIMLRNDPLRKYVNGSIGKVVELSDDIITVRIHEGPTETEVNVEKHTWEMIKYTWDKEKRQIDAQVTGVFEQYPMKLAWAMTIHKSQGKSFNHVYLDMAHGAFETGQTYVALSRCTSLEGLQLKQALRPSDILVDERIADYYNQWR